VYHMLPKLEGVGLAWANFQVMRRTHATLMKTLGADGKLVADQLGHTLDVNQNVYSPYRYEPLHSTRARGRSKVIPKIACAHDRTTRRHPSYKLRGPAS